MSKILAGYIMDGNSGGIDRYLLNFLDTVWIEGMQIDFLSDRRDIELEKRLKKYGSRIFPVASLKHPLKQYRQTKKIILENEYDIVYLNISTAIDCIGAKAARDCHVKEVLLHSHSGGNDCESELKRHLYNMFHAVCKTFFYRFGNRHYGCSKSAGYWMYPEKIVDSADFQVVYNAVDREQYQYDSAIRENVRREMGAEDSLILGHVGNFCYQKNHEFLMRVFAEVIKIRPDAQLWCLGRGVGYEKIVKLASELGIGGNVRFLGQKKNPEYYYQGMDVFVLPSRFEGLPLVGVEAQCMKLACIFSDSITEEVKIQDHAAFLSLKDSPVKWAKQIVEAGNYDRECVRLLEQAECYDLRKQREQMRDLICH